MACAIALAPSCPRPLWLMAVFRHAHYLLDTGLLGLLQVRSDWFFCRICAGLVCQAGFGMRDKPEQGRLLLAGDR